MYLIASTMDYLQAHVHAILNVDLLSFVFGTDLEEFAKVVCVLVTHTRRLLPFWGHSRRRIRGGFTST